MSNRERDRKQGYSQVSEAIQIYTPIMGRVVWGKGKKNKKKVARRIR